MGRYDPIKSEPCGFIQPSLASRPLSIDSAWRGNRRYLQSARGIYSQLEEGALTKNKLHTWGENPTSA
jgi:hypothetical protein